MASLDFPSSPTSGQVFTGGNGVQYVWSGTVWLASGASAGGDFMATNSADFTISTPAVRAWNTVMNGNAGNYYSTSTGRYTPPAGRYLIRSQLKGATSGAGNTIYTAIRKNGVDVGYSLDTATSAGNWAECDFEAIVDANGTDYFENTLWADAVTTSTAGYFLAYPISGIKGPPGDATPGTLIQTVSTQTGAVATGTTILPIDDTIPQITEGTEFMTLAITPRSATSKLVVNVLVNLSFSVAANNVAAALFQDSTANALTSALIYQSTLNAVQQIRLSYVVTSGTTSSTTFRVRAGGQVAGTLTFNGNGGLPIFGGNTHSSIVITETAT